MPTRRGPSRTTEETHVRIGLPVHGSRLSPVFDWSRKLLLVDAHDGNEIARDVTDLGDIGPLLRAKRLSDLGTQVLLCGGVSQPVLATLKAHGIRSIPWLAGEVEEILGAYLATGGPLTEFALPRCRGLARGGGRGCGRGSAGRRRQGRYR